MKRTLRTLLLAVYAVTAVLTAGCLLSQWVSPGTLWPLAFVGLLFPLMFALQVVFLFVFLFLKSKAIIIPLLLIIAGWHAASLTFQIPVKAVRQEDPEALRVMTYNVRLFDIFNWSGKKGQGDGIFGHLEEVKPDILCIQEFAYQDPGRYSLPFIKEKLGFLPYSAIRFNAGNRNNRHGLAIFSRYPIVDSGHAYFEDTKNMMLYADLDIGTDTIRVYNNHLESIHFDRDELKWIDDKDVNTRIPRDKLTEIIKRMKGAYRKRAVQAGTVRNSIDSSPHPVVVCGDFNDTPVSFATHRIGSGLYDSFRSGGQWMGITFPDVIAPLRIDYILHSRELQSYGHTVGRVNFSDHRPVSCMVRPVRNPAQAGSYPR